VPDPSLVPRTLYQWIVKELLFLRPAAIVAGFSRVQKHAVARQHGTCVTKLMK
jgi:hypothetical protein